MKNEIYKTINGYSDYQVSNFGNVMKIGYGNLKQATSRCGYRHVSLTNAQGEPKTFLVHRLVAMAFLENPNNLEQIDHIDNDRSNNQVANLRWTSRKFNNSRKNARIMKSINSKHSEHYRQGFRIEKDGEVHIFATQKEAADYIGCSRVLLVHVLADDIAHKAFGWSVSIPTSDEDKAVVQQLNKTFKRKLEIKKSIARLEKRIATWESHDAKNLKLAQRKVEIFKNEIEKLNKEMEVLG